jgi:hypothetical protein
MWLRISVYVHIHGPDLFDTFKHEVNHSDLETFISFLSKHMISLFQRPVV